ncbi:hypothetical protein [Clostridium fessum]|uniref:hypothetical protein n=1 Tax=Clostridium fessum TaxID=2126740 RepID=UPI0039A300F1
MRRLNLRMFDGEGGGEGSAATGAEAAAPETTEGQKAEQTPEEREKAFNDMINGDFRDLFDARMQKAIKERVGEVKQLQQQLQQQNDVIGLVAKKYGISTDKMGDIREALESDDVFWEEAAADQGMTVDSYKKMVKLEAENEALHKAREEAERKNQKDAVFQKWDREAEELKRMYPQFDLQSEIQDERFLDLMGAGIDMRTIYETLHHDEILPALMQQTAKAATKQQAAAARSGQMRPAENGMSSRPAAQTVKDPAKMTKEERQEYARRAARGEIITFRD